MLEAGKAMARINWARLAVDATETSPPAMEVVGTVGSATPGSAVSVSSACPAGKPPARRM